MNDLMIKIDKKPREIFVSGGLEPFISEVEKLVRDTQTDPTTPAGRTEIKSLAYKVAKTKSHLDKLGKDLGSDLRLELSQINDERKRGVNRLQALQDEVRKPVDEYEEREKKRVQHLETLIASLTATSNWEGKPTTADVAKALEDLKGIYEGSDFQEYAKRAAETFEAETERLEKLLAELEKQEAEQRELEKLRKEKAERERKEREDRIAKEAALKAKQDAERAAKEAIAAAERKAQAALEEERRERIAEVARIENAKAKAINDARIAAEAKAKAAAAAEKKLSDAKESAIRTVQGKEGVVKKLLLILKEGISIQTSGDLFDNSDMIRWVKKAQKLVSEVEKDG